MRSILMVSSLALDVTMGHCRSDTPTFYFFTQSNASGVLSLFLQWQDFESFHYSQTSLFEKLSKTSFIWHA